MTSDDVNESGKFEKMSSTLDAYFESLASESIETVKLIKTDLLERARRNSKQLYDIDAKYSILFETKRAENSEVSDIIDDNMEYADWFIREKKAKKARIEGMAENKYYETILEDYIAN